MGNSIRFRAVWLLALSSGIAFGKGGSSGPSNNYFCLDVGAYATQVDKRMGAAADYGNKVSTLAGFLRARKTISFFSGVQWEPSIGMMVPWRSGADGFAKTFFVHTGLGFGFSPLSWVHMRLGPGILWRLTITNSEQLALNNGTGTSNFYIPGGSKSIFQFTADLGMDFRLSQSWSIGFDVWIMELMNTKRRTLNGAVTIGFYL